jgi:hypothetical protein
MGAPGYTRFCENGHIVEVVMHHGISEYDCILNEELPPCKICGSKKSESVMEWGNSDYLDNHGAGPVPLNPIGQDTYVSDMEATIVVGDGMGGEIRQTGKLVVTVDKYDVSNLFTDD